MFSCVTFTSEHCHTAYTSPTRNIKTHHIAISSIIPYRLKNFNSQYFNHCPFLTYINPLTPNDHCSGRTAPLTSKRFILYIYSTNIGTGCFKHDIYSPFFSLQNAVCFIILTYLAPVLFTFYIQGVLKLKKKLAPKG